MPPRQLSGVPSQGVVSTAMNEIPLQSQECLQEPADPSDPIRTVTDRPLVCGLQTRIVETGKQTGRKL